MCMYMCMYRYIYVYVFVGTYMCMYLWKRQRLMALAKRWALSLCMYTCTYIHTWALSLCIYTCTYIHTYIHVCTNICIYIYIYICMHSFIHIWEAEELHRLCLCLFCLYWQMISFLQGRMPRTIECELSEDLVDMCIPGDEVRASYICVCVCVYVCSRLHVSSYTFKAWFSEVQILRWSMFPTILKRDSHKC